MTRRLIYTLAVIYTILVVLATALVSVSLSVVIIVIANAWFWVGRLSSHPPVEAEAGDPPPIKWGRQ